MCEITRGRCRVPRCDVSPHRVAYRGRHRTHGDARKTGPHNSNNSHGENIHTETWAIKNISHTADVGVCLPSSEYALCITILDLLERMLTPVQTHSSICGFWDTIPAANYPVLLFPRDGYNRHLPAINLYRCD